MKRKNQEIDINKLLDIYLDGFEDSRSFAEWFISSVPQEDIFLHSDNEMPVSAGYIIKKRAHLFGKDTVLPYLSALATKKEFRGKGKISIIIKQAFEALSLRGFSFVVLNPFDDTYYKRYGFTDIAFCERTVIPGGKQYLLKQVTEDDIETLCAIENANAEFFNNYLLKDKAEVLKLIKNFSIDEIRCMLVYEHDEPVAFYFCSGDKIEYSASVAPGILEQAEILKGKKYENCFSENDTYIQGRIINAEKAILEYDYDKDIQEVCQFSIRDNILEKNNKEITVEILQGMAKLSSKAPLKHFALDISELCGLMFLGGGVFKKSKNLFKDKY